MKNQHISILALAVSFSFGTTAQSQDLAALQSKLTVDCKSIRGHAIRIAAEAGEQEFNRDVAEAHLGQVARFHASMKKDLEGTEKALNKQQRPLVAGEMQRLKKICDAVGKGVEDLEDRFAEASPDRISIKRIATTLKNEMTEGSRVHERMKKILGIL